MPTTPDDAGTSLDNRHGMTTLAFEPLRRDVAYAIRTYRRAPGVAITAAISLGLAIGATTAIVSLLNALVLRQLPVNDPASLVQVSTTTRLQGEAQLTYPLFRELAARQQVFSDVIGTWGNSVLTVNDNGALSKALVWAGTGNLHHALGLAPSAGRLLAERDMSLDGSAGAPVAVIGDGFWQRHYRGDPSVVGRTIHIENQPFTIVGVAPAGFTGFSVVTEPDLTIPLAAVPLLSGRSPSSFATSEARIVRMVGRLKPSVTLDQARAQLAAVWPSAREAAVPPTYSDDRRAEFLSIDLRVTSAATGTDTTLRRQYTRPLVILLGVATLVLLIACTTVAGLLLSRASTRRHEIGMRLALGASRWHVARQLITEGVVLSLAGAAGGILLSYWACAAIVRIVFDELLVPAVFNGGPDGRVVALTTMAAVVAGVLCTLVPAWRGTRGTAVDALRADARTMSRSSHTGRLIVGTQLALSLVLLATAGVLIRSLSELHALDTGIERSDNVFVAYPEAARPGAYAKVDNDSYYREVLRRIESLPGVTHASISLLKPGSGGGFRDAVVPIGAIADAAGVDATRSPVSPGFFDAVGLRIVKGRGFDWRDSSRNQGVTVLSESLARTLFGNSDPIGQRVRVGLDPSRNSVEVIGVVADARLYDLKDSDLMAAYTAALQDRNASLKCFVIRADGLSPTALHAAVEQLGVERVGNIVTLQYITDRSLLLERLTASISTFFGALVVLLAGVGVFGLMSQAVTQRRKEIGIRMAVGANRSRVVRDVVRDTLIVTLGGVAAGLLGAVAAVRLVETLLFGVTPQDPLALSAAAASLIVTALLACTLPAIRASRTDPLIALRSD
jgi:putative ABC transport system permease protein